MRWRGVHNSLPGKDDYGSGRTSGTIAAGGRNCRVSYAGRCPTRGTTGTRAKKSTEPNTSQERGRNPATGDRGDVGGPVRDGKHWSRECDEGKVESRCCGAGSRQGAVSGQRKWQKQSGNGLHGQTGANESCWDCLKEQWIACGPDRRPLDGKMTARFRTFRKHRRPCGQPAVAGGIGRFRPVPPQAGHLMRINATPSDFPFKSTGFATYPEPPQLGQSSGATPSPPRVRGIFS